MRKPTVFPCQSRKDNATGCNAGDGVAAGTEQSQRRRKDEPCCVRVCAMHRVQRGRHIIGR